MDIRLDQDWRMRPIKGDTGKPISGSRTTTKSLSNEIRPRCLRHSLKRALHPNSSGRNGREMGDTLSAQEWLDGRVLDPDEIGQRNDVIDVLYHLHHSKTLAQMLSKIGGQVRTPEQMLMDYQDQLPLRWLKTVLFIWSPSI